MTARHAKRLRLVFQSVGGGSIVLTTLQDWPVHLTGDAYDVMVVSASHVAPIVSEHLTRDGKVAGVPEQQTRDDATLLHVRRAEPLDADALAQVERLPGVREVWTTEPLFFVQRSPALFSSAAEMIGLAETRECSLGRLALAYEAALLGLPETDVLAEVLRRFQVMRTTVERGIDEQAPSPSLFSRPLVR